MSESHIIVVGVAALGIIVAVLALVSRLRWESALDRVARSLKGRYTKGRTVGLAFIPGHVEAMIDGREVTIERESYFHGSPGSSREAKRLLIKASTSQSKPEYLGPPRPGGDAPTVTDYGHARSNDQDGPLEIDGRRLEVVKMSKKLAKRLDADPAAKDLLARLLDAGGRIDHGNVVIHGSPWIADAVTLEQHARVAAAVADLID